MHAARLDVTDGGDGIGDRLARNETPREGARAGHPISGRQRFQELAARESLKEGLGCNIQHQCVRPDPDVSR